MSKTPRTIMTLDAGGTNFVFSAIQDHEEVVEPITLPANAHDLSLCLEGLIKGFEAVKQALKSPPVAISFAFPGPADYELGIIGNLPNFRAFNGGVPIGPMLEDHFGLPVFINNDGNLFAYGEALAGALPWINRRLMDNGNVKQYKNLIGITLGTGFGCGIVLDQKLLLGDNSCGAEIHNTLNPANPSWNAEESVSTRAVQREYAERAGVPFDARLMPGDVYAIAKGEKEGDRDAALAAFEAYGAALGSSVANVLTLIDGIVVIGGGLSAGRDLFFPAMMKSLTGKYVNFRNEPSDKLSFEVFNLEDPQQMDQFLAENTATIQVPGSNRQIVYDNRPRVGIMLSRLGASRATALGAYTYALSKLGD